MSYEADERIAIQQEGSGRRVAVKEIHPVISEDGTNLSELTHEKTNTLGVGAVAEAGD